MNSDADRPARAARLCRAESACVDASGGRADPEGIARLRKGASVVFIQYPEGWSARSTIAEGHRHRREYLDLREVVAETPMRAGSKWRVRMRLPILRARRGEKLGVSKQRVEHERAGACHHVEGRDEWSEHGDLEVGFGQEARIGPVNVEELVDQIGCPRPAVAPFARVAFDHRAVELVRPACGTAEPRGPVSKRDRACKKGFEPAPVTVE